MSTSLKTCFKCGETKPHSEFYRHAQMGDGLLGKCKICARTDSSLRRSVKIWDQHWVAKERARCREKRVRMNLKFPEKVAARAIIQKALRQGKVSRKPCQVCGNPKSDGHHNDYSKPLKVEWLCRKHHMERHLKAA